jgi:hypothetical protein
MGSSEYFRSEATRLTTAAKRRGDSRRQAMYDLSMLYGYALHYDELVSFCDSVLNSVYDPKGKQFTVAALLAVFAARVESVDLL